MQDRLGVHTLDKPTDSMSLTVLAVAWMAILLNRVTVGFVGCTSCPNMMTISSPHFQQYNIQAILHTGFFIRVNNFKDGVQPNTNKHGSNVGECRYHNHSFSFF